MGNVHSMPEVVAAKVWVCELLQGGPLILTGNGIRLILTGFSTDESKRAETEAPRTETWQSINQITAPR